jgi:hypothetical protein
MKSSKMFAAAALMIFASLTLFPQSIFAGKVVQPQPVTIENASVSTENSPQQPFQWSGDKYFDYSAQVEGGGFMVPDGKRLVIEYVLGHIDLEKGEVTKFQILTTINGVQSVHFFAISPAGVSNPILCTKGFTSGQSVRLYADPETPVELQAIKSDLGEGWVTLDISGYLVDVK